MNALMHRSGNTWHRVTPAALAGFRYSSIAVFGVSDVWVAGSAAGTRRLAHYNGHGWRTVAMPGPAVATGLCRDGHGGLWVIANVTTGGSRLRHLSRADRWSTSFVSRFRVNQVLACARVPGSDAVWGAGTSAARAGSAAAVYGFGRVP